MESVKGGEGSEPGGDQGRGLGADALPHAGHAVQGEELQHLVLVKYAGQVDDVQVGGEDALLNKLVSSLLLLNSDGVCGVIVLVLVGQAYWEPGTIQTVKDINYIFDIPQVSLYNTLSQIIFLTFAFRFDFGNLSLSPQI